MWIASQYGFYSVVFKEGVFHLRARVRGDLENLLRILPAAVDFDIETWPSADYRYRLRLDANQFGQVWEVLGNSIDYPNFKSRIAQSANQKDRLSTYHQIWSLMMQHQKEVDQD